VIRVAQLNSERRGPNDATFAVGKFADLSPQQFANQYLTLKKTDLPSDAATLERDDVASTPDETVDWRDKGVITPVKDQGQCGSCWAFSVTETVESNYAIQSGKTVPVLGPEQLVDCDTQDDGCDGGITEWAFKYLIKAGGLMSEADYPYKAGQSGRKGPCRFQAAKVIAPVKNFTYVGKPCMYVGESCDNQDENLVVDALVRTGPMSICVNANWQDYKGGIFSGRCPHAAANINHAVQLVGFNRDQKYWIVRNSWNTNWGVNGYIYLKMGGNTCGVANIVIFPGTV